LISVLKPAEVFEWRGHVLDTERPAAAIFQQRSHHSVLTQATACRHFDVMCLVGRLDQLPQDWVLQLEGSHFLLSGWPRDCGAAVGLLLVVLHQSCNPIWSLDLVREEVVRVRDMIGKGGPVGANLAFFGVPVNMDHLMKAVCDGVKKYPTNQVLVRGEAWYALSHRRVISGVLHIKECAIFRVCRHPRRDLAELVDPPASLPRTPHASDVRGGTNLHLERDKGVQPHILCTLAS
jgi:hypothetical protein